MARTVPEDLAVASHKLVDVFPRTSLVPLSLEAGKPNCHDAFYHQPQWNLVSCLPVPQVARNVGFSGASLGL